MSFFLSFIAPSVYTGCTKINYKIAPVTNFNKYSHCGTCGNEYIDTNVNNGNEKEQEKTLRLLIG